MIGELRRYEPVTDTADPQWRSLAQAAPQRRTDRGDARIREHILDGCAQCSGEPQRRIDSRDVVAGLDRGDELPADAGARGELRLGEPGGQATVAKWRWGCCH